MQTEQKSIGHLTGSAAIHLGAEDFVLAALDLREAVAVLTMRLVDKQHDVTSEDRPCGIAQSIEWLRERGIVTELEGEHLAAGYAAAASKLDGRDVQPHQLRKLGCACDAVAARLGID